VQALVTLIERYRPGFADEVRPADERRIQSLAQLAGPLPGALLRFLRTMGGSPPRLLVDALFLGVDPMRRALLSADWLKDDRYLILTKWDAVDAMIWIDRATPTPPDDAMLVSSPWMDTPEPQPKTPHAWGLEDLLYVEAFRGHRLAMFDHHAALATTDTPDAAQLADALARPLGLDFERLAPTLTSGLFDRGDAAIIVRRAPRDAALHVHIAAETPETLAPLVDAFAGRPGWAPA
jgi:hypothetical protein